ncbi:MAG: IPT/TIG domain-containing protein, partial [Bacteroidales bacterium]|nr:IPT/TIG domain-containing protein [Bacteroidales bacterium]
EGPYNAEIFAEIKGSNFLVLQQDDLRLYPEVQVGKKVIKRQDDKGNTRLWVIDSKTGKEVDGSPTNSRGDTIKIVIPATPYEVPGISVDVKVTNPDGGTPVTKDKIFMFTDPAAGTIPIITEVKPNIAPINGGTEIKVTGSGFRQGAYVTIDGVAVSNMKINGAGTEITFKTPVGRPGRTRLQIINPLGGGLAWADFEYTVIYTSPRITKISPNSGSKGTIVTIKGESFLSPDATADFKEIYKIIGSRILFNDTGEAYELNEYNLQDGKILLKEFNSGNTILSLDGTKPMYNEEYLGTMLQDTANQKLYYMYKDNQGNIMLRDWQGGLYKVVYEGLGTGSKMILIKTTGGVSTELVQSTADDGTKLSFSVSIDGVVTDITLQAITPYKVEGIAGAQKITGHRVRVLDEKTIELTIPEGLKEGKKDVTVVNPDTADFTVKDGFTYFSNPNGSKPVIHTVAPAEGTVAGGTIIKITGKDFRQGAEVYFGSEKSPSATANDLGDTIKAVLPPYPGDLRRDKGTDHIDVPIVVINKSDGGTAVWHERFIYRVPTSYPIITTIDPSKGSSYGDMQIVILGDNFVEYGEPYTDINGNGSYDLGEPYTDFDINGIGYPNDEGKGNGRRDSGCTHEFIDPVNGGIIKKVIPKLAPRVYFGGEEAEIIDYGYRRLVVNLPRYDGQGAVDVVVVNPDTGTIVKKGGFTYTASSPKIGSIIPAVGSKIGGTEVSVVGQEFIIGKSTDPTSMVQVFIGDDKDISSSLILGGKLADPIKISNLTVDYDSTKGANNTELKMTYSIKAEDGSIKDVIATLHSHIIEDKKEYFVTFDPTPSVNMFKNKDGTDISPADYAALNQLAFGKEGIKAKISDSVITVTRRLAEIMPNSSSDTLLVIKTPPSNTIGFKDFVITNNDGGKVTGKFEYGNPLSKPRID